MGNRKTEHLASNNQRGEERQKHVNSTGGLDPDTSRPFVNKNSDEKKAGEEETQPKIKKKKKDKRKEQLSGRPKGDFGKKKKNELLPT